MRTHGMPNLGSWTGCQSRLTSVKISSEYVPPLELMEKPRDLFKNGW